jgi:hypothetical protein
MPARRPRKGVHRKPKRKDYAEIRALGSYINRKAEERKKRRKKLHDKPKKEIKGNPLGEKKFSLKGRFAFKRKPKYEPVKVNVVHHEPTKVYNPYERNINAERKETSVKQRVTFTQEPKERNFAEKILDKPTHESHVNFGEQSST